MLRVRLCRFVREVDHAVGGGGGGGGSSGCEGVVSNGLVEIEVVVSLVVSGGCEDGAAVGSG